MIHSRSFSYMPGQYQEPSWVLFCCSWFWKALKDKCPGYVFVNHGWEAGDKSSLGLLLTASQCFPLPSSLPPSFRLFLLPSLSFFASSRLYSLSPSCPSSFIPFSPPFLPPSLLGPQCTCQITNPSQRSSSFCILLVPPSVCLGINITSFTHFQVYHVTS